MSRLQAMKGLPAFTAAGNPSEERMHWLQVPMQSIEALYDSGVLKVQRNHLRRLQTADHITRAQLPLHANYLAARFPDGGMQLIDGYTRMAAIRAGRTPRPERAWLGVVDVDSAKQVEQVYLAVDSRKAVKTGRDAFEEGLRKAGLLGKLVSPVFVNGYAVTAVQAAAGEADTLRAVVKLKRAIELLDPLRLEVGRFALPAGALAACLLLAQHEQDEQGVLRFTAAVARPDHLSASDRRLVPGAVKFSAWLQERRDEGALSGKNVPLIMQQALGAFESQRSGSAGRPEPMSREAYLASVGGR